jgi:hypothetical protein
VTYKLAQSTVRDFGGGWDVSDSDKSLSSKYQPISDNIVRQTDGSFSIRPGSRLFADLKQGAETVVAPAACTVVTTGSAINVVITSLSKSGVGGPAVCTVAPADIAKFVNNMVVNITGVPAVGMTPAMGPHIISSVGAPANTFTLAGVDTSGAAAAQTDLKVKASTIATGVVKITKATHGMSDGDHINITSWSAPIGGIAAADFLGVHAVDVIDGNNFTIYVRAVPTTASASITIGWTRDTHALGGGDIYGRYYKDSIFVFSDTGEVVKVDVAGTVTKVWNHAIAQALAIPMPPWSNCRRISAEIVKGHLLAVNGATNDKPLDIFTNATTGVTTCNYLVNDMVDNTAIPRADFIIATDRYVLLISTDRTPNGPTTICISAQDTYYVFTGDPFPDDAVDIDLGMVTSAVETTILGANVIRNKVFIALHDRSILGDLGIYSGAFHQPEFKDNVAMLGSFSHHSIISLGNDIFCAAINGINSLEISRASGEYTPTTISDLIHPVMLRHFARLVETDRRYKTFAVWDSNFRSYMMFAPKYSDVTYDLPDDPIVASNTLQPHGLAYMLLPSHTFDAGDYVTISGVTNSLDGLILAANINGVRRIRAVVDEDTVVIEVPLYPTGLNYAFGGINGAVKPVNDETPAYVFEYNARLKIRRWTRFRGMNFAWGAVSQLSRLYFGSGTGRVYKYGNALDKFPADMLGDYTKRVWAINTAYVAGDRILDASYRQVYIVLVNHTSPASGTFKAARDAHPTWYDEFTGIPIDWELETSWTDFKDRMSNKQIEVVRFDSKGSSEFEFSIYTNSIREDFETFELIPRRTTIFIGQDAPGFGAGAQPYGGGRNTRQEWLRGMPVEGKLFRLRFAGSSVKPLTVSAATMYYHKKSGALT